MRVFNSGIISNSDLETPYFLAFKEGCFVFMKSEKRSCAFFLDPSKLTKRKFKVLLKSSVDYLKIESSDVEVKVLCCSFSKDSVEDVFGHYKFKSCTLSLRNSKVEIYYYPKKNKVRLTKSEGKSKKINIENLKESVVLVPKKIKVLIVDDSKTIRTILKKVFSEDKELEVVATAEKPSEVEALILKYRPDVITLDIHMPEMDGVTLLKKLLPKFHIPTIMISSISMEEGPMVLSALEAGAIDYIQKPSFEEIAVIKEMIIEKVKAASDAIVSRKVELKLKQIKVDSSDIDSNALICMGSSTGGTEALRSILLCLPDQIPPILIVQHIPPIFSKAFAKRMNSLVKYQVKEAEDGDDVAMNTVYIAPGGYQMALKKVNNAYKIIINDDPPVNRFKPSVDYMFQQVYEKVDDKNIISVILTGMGKDGAKEMLNLYNAGAHTIAQDEDTSVVFGMPKEAIECGAVKVVAPLEDIAGQMVQAFDLRRQKAS